ncbi:hypothetical protein GCM10022221_18150 [Actinocorallia aurea]
MDGKSLKGFSVKSEDRGEVVAVFSTFLKRDSDGDVTLPGAFTNGAEVLISAYGHKSWDGLLPVGRGRIVTSSTDARLHGRFFLDTTAGRDTFTVVKELGQLGQWSYGYDVLDQEYGTFEGKQVRFLKSLAVHEVSPVLVGAGRGVRTLSAKSASTDRAALQREHERFLRHEARGQHRRFVETSQRLELSAIRERIREDSGFTYSECAAPSLGHQAAAEMMMHTTARELGIEAPLPRLLWFSPETAAEKAYARKYGCRDWDAIATDVPVRGAYRKGDHTVWIAAGLSHADVMATVAHEMRHAAGGDEQAAQDYEQGWHARLPHPN